MAARRKRRTTAQMLDDLRAERATVVQRSEKRVREIDARIRGLEARFGAVEIIDHYRAMPVESLAEHEAELKRELASIRVARGATV